MGIRRLYNEQCSGSFSGTVVWNAALQSKISRSRSKAPKYRANGWLFSPSSLGTQGNNFLLMSSSYWERERERWREKRKHRKEKDQLHWTTCAETLREADGNHWESNLSLRRSNVTIWPFDRSANVFCSTQLRPSPLTEFVKPLLNTRWVRSLNTFHELSNIEKKNSRPCRDLGPGLLGEKLELYLCEMPPPNNCQCLGPPTYQSTQDNT